MPYEFDKAAALRFLREDPDLTQSPMARVEAVVSAVNATHAGRPIAEVDAELRRRFAQHGFTPVEAAFADVVWAIAESDPLD